MKLFATAAIYAAMAVGVVLYQIISSFRGTQHQH